MSKSYNMNQPGIYDGIPAIEYHKDPCLYPSLSASIAHLLITETPLVAKTNHPRLNKTFQPTHKKEFDLGSAAHSYILEGNESAIHVIDAKDYRTDKAKAERDKAYDEGKYPVLAGRVEDVKGMAEMFIEKIDKSKELKGILQRGKPEQTICWKENKLYFRSRTDWLTNEYDIMIDYKTSDSANRNTFIRGPLSNLGYDMKAEFYMRGLRAVTESPLENTIFVWIVQETSKPYDLSFIGYSEQMKATAKRKVDLAIKIWKECTEKDEWPGYSSEIAWAELPPYAVQRFEEFEMLNEMGVI